MTLTILYIDVNELNVENKSFQYSKSSQKYKIMDEFRKSIYI